MINLKDVKTWRVLVIDDEPDNLDVVKETLEFFGADVCVAHDGIAGLEVADTYLPNIVLLDLAMPRMDGWETRMRLLEKSYMKGVPIVGVSAHAMPGDKERAIAAGFNGYLTKPIDIFTLVEDIRKVASINLPS